MVLDLWNTGDTVTALLINKRGIRRGTTSDITGISGTLLTIGDHFFNTTFLSGQLLTHTTANIWANYGIHMIAADSTTVSITGTTPTQVKDVDFIIDPQTISGTLLIILIRLQASANTANCRIRLNGSGSDSLVLSTTNAGLTVLKGTIDISALSAGRNTIQVFLDNSTGGQSATMDMTEIWGI